MKRPRSIRRIIKRAVIFLLLGAVVNVTVAWSSVRWAPFPTGNPVVFQSGTHTKPIGVYNRRSQLGASLSVAIWNEDPNNAVDDDASDLNAVREQWGLWAWPDLDNPGPDSVVHMSVARGLPFHALWSGYDATYTKANERPEGQAYGGIVIDTEKPPLERDSVTPMEASPPSQLPLLPIWPGFLLNTLIYAVLIPVLILSARSAWHSFRNMRPRMRCLAGVALLTMGLLSTIIVAWGAAHWLEQFNWCSAMDGRYGPFGKRYETSWLRTRSITGTHIEIESRWRTTDVNEFDPPPEQFDDWAMQVAGGDNIPKKHDLHETRTGMAWGWPMHALWYGVIVYRENHRMMGGSVEEVHMLHAIPSPFREMIDSSELDVGYLPTGPIWTGLIVDTLLYAVLWLGVFGLLTSPFMLRRGRRHRHGLCIECAYDLRGDLVAGCPECGWNREQKQPPIEESP